MGRSTSRPGAAPEKERVGLQASPEALGALRAALAGQPEGTGVRVWVETGIRPQVRMMFDRPSPRDLREELDGIPVWVDSLSARFLQGARIEYLDAPGQQGFRVVGPNVPGGGASPPEGAAEAPAAGAASEGTPTGQRAIEEKLRTALRQIYDPEIPMNLVDLGLIYGFEWTPAGALTIRMTLTSIGCPATEAIRSEVERAAREASGLPEVRVEIVWEPPWTPDRMSLFAKRQFGYV